MHDDDLRRVGDDEGEGEGLEADIMRASRASRSTAAPRWLASSGDGVAWAFDSEAAGAT